MSKKTKSSGKANVKLSIFSRKNFILLLLALMAITYGKTIGFGYTYFDDDAIVIRNEAYLSDISNIPESILRDAEFQKQSIELYRPLQNISFIVDSQWFGVNPKTFHFTNLLIHFLSISLLFLLLLELKMGERISFIGALVYAVHPLFAYTVTWIPARGDLLLGLFGLAAIYFYIKYLNTKEVKYLIFHFLGFVLALLSKESAVMLVPILWVYQFYVIKTTKPNKYFYLSIAVYTMVILIFLYMRFLSIAHNSGGNFGLSAFYNNLPTLPESILKFFFPVNIVLLPFFNTTRTIMGLLVIVALIGLFIRSLKSNQKLKIWGIFWLLVLILPGMAYNPSWSEYIYNYLLHRSYLPFIGLLIFVLLIIKPWLVKLELKKVISLSLVVVVLLLAINFNFNKSFSSPQVFWEKAVSTNPNSAFSNSYLGNIYLMNNQLNNAVKSYDKALKIKPDLKEALINRGMAKLQMNLLEGAIRDLTSYLEIDSTNQSAKKYLAEAYFKAKNYAAANKIYNALNAATIIDEGMKYNWGLSLFFIKKYKDSFKIFKTIIDKQPDNINLTTAYAIAALMSRNTEEAILKNELLLTKDKKNISTLCNLGYAYWEGKYYRKALAVFEKASTLASKNIDVNLGFALCYYALDRNKELMLVKENVLDIAPKLRQASQGIAALEQEGFIFTPKQKETLIAIFETGK